MALILPPFRPKGLLRAAGQQAPASGLAAFYSFASASDAWRDSVTGQPGTTDAGQTRCITPDGPGLQYNGSARVVYTNYQNPASVQTEFLTVVARAKLTTLPGGSACVVTYGTTNSGRAAICGFNPSGNALCGAITSAGIIAINDSVNHLGEWVTIAGSGQGAQGNGAGWLNGIYLGSNFGGGGSGTPTRINLGRDDTGYFAAFTGQVSWVAAFNRILTNAEHLAIHRDPYGFCLGVNPNRRPFFGSAGGTVYNVGVTESASGADSQSSQGNLGANDNESGSAVETISAQGTFPRTVNESASPADTVTNGASYSDSVAETVTPTDTQNAQLTIPGAASDSAPITDSIPTQAVFGRTVNESAPGSDSESSQGTHGVGDNESAPAVETITTQGTFPRTVTESAPATEQVANTATLPSGIVETAPITDQEGAAGPGQSDIVESAPITDQYSAQMIRPVTVTESAPISDAYLASLTLSQIVAEVASATNSQTAQLLATVAVLETAPGVDQYLTQLIAQIAVQELAAANDAFDQTGTVLVASPCNTLAGAPRTRMLAGEARVRILRGGCC